MKATYYISFGFPRERLAEVRAFLDAMGLSDAIQPPLTPMGLPTFEQTFDAADPRIETLIDYIRQQGFHFFRRLDCEYTPRELKKYPLVRLGVAGAPIAGGLPRDDTEYDVSSACPQCGTGAVQVSPILLLQRDALKKRDILTTYSGHVLVSERVARAFREQAVSGVELRQALAKRTRAPLAWWQILCLYTMPKMSPATRGVKRDTGGCPVCQRDMYCGTATEPCDTAYDSAEVDPATLPDIVQTWECFGRSVLHDDPDRHLIRGFAQPDILVKPRVMQILLDLKVKHACFQPVRFV